MRDHETAKLVNALRDVAIEYHGSQQLRERIAALVGPLAADHAKLRAALHGLVDRDFTFFSGGMVGASKKITRDEVLAARRALGVNPIPDGGGQ